MSKKSNEDEEQAFRENQWTARIIKLFFAGFFIILLGIIILIAAALLAGDSNISIGGFILIWFIPIVFGAGPEAPWLTVLAVILGVLGLIMFLILWKKAK
ncbi:MAG: DUF131 domain-containing protein [Candidatus Bathyarchaeia archaeon]